VQRLRQQVQQQVQKRPQQQVQRQVQQEQRLYHKRTGTEPTEQQRSEQRISLYFLQLIIKLREYWIYFISIRFSLSRCEAQHSSIYFEYFSVYRPFTNQV
jgi:hypothetical protein